MQKITDWVQQNKLFALTLALILAYFFINSSTMFLGSRVMVSQEAAYAPGKGIGGMAPESMARDMNLYSPDPAAPSDSANRLVVQNAQLSLLVKDVTDVQRQINQHVTSIGGNMVSRETNRPTEQPFGTISFRVPSDQLDTTLEKIKTFGIKVTYETISGYDVTDQYEDLETKISYLRRSLNQMLTLQDQATKFEDILRATQEVQNLQRQIDSLLGRQNYLQQTAKMSLVTVSLSTDELALPYAPDTNFRPALIYKQAVRSLISTLQNLGELAIWLAVYAVIWVPLLIGIILFRKYRQTPPAK